MAVAISLTSGGGATIRIGCSLLFDCCLYQLLYVAFEDLVHAAGLALKQMLLLQVLFHRQLVLFAYFGVRHGILRYFLY